MIIEQQQQPWHHHHHQKQKQQKQQQQQRIVDNQHNHHHHHHHHYHKNITNKWKELSFRHKFFLTFLFMIIFSLYSQLFYNFIYFFNTKPSSSVIIRSVTKRQQQQKQSSSSSSSSTFLFVPHHHSYKFIVVAPTYYTNLEDVRYKLALEACQQASKNYIRLIIIDNSPIKDIQTSFYEAGKINNDDNYSYVRVIKQVNTTANGKKGIALREGIKAAYDELMTTTNDSNNNNNNNNEITIKDENCFIAFQELEKVDMFNHWNTIIESMVKTTTTTTKQTSSLSSSSSSIIVVGRSNQSFKDTYPIDQYYAETFGNLYLNSLGIQIGLPSTLDWTMGPIAFQCTYTHHWLNFNGQLWDAQIVPMIYAYLYDNAIISSYEINYQHPISMKMEEQGKSIWIEKRLMQLNYLSEFVATVLKKEAATTTNDKYKNKKKQ